MNIYILAPVKLLKDSYLNKYFLYDFYYKNLILMFDKNRPKEGNHKFCIEFLKRAI